MKCLRSFWGAFLCNLYCRAVNITDNLCAKQGKSSIFGPKIRGFKSRRYSNKVLDYANHHELRRTSNEGINQSNLQFWANMADKICFGLIHKFWSWIWFSAVQWRQFSYRVSVVGGQNKTSSHLKKNLVEDLHTYIYLLLTMLLSVSICHLQIFMKNFSSRKHQLPFEVIFALRPREKNYERLREFVFLSCG